MKTLNFNKNSWHYRLVTKLKLYRAPYQKDIWGDGELYTMGDSGDICTYSNRVVLALLIVGMGVVSFVFVSMIVIHTLLGIYFSVLMSQWFFTEFGNVGAILSSSAIIFVGILMASHKIVDLREKNSHKPKLLKPDTFLDNAYKAWKNKFCVPINFNE